MLAAPDAGQLTSGALYVFARSPCHAGSFKVQARHLLEGPSDGKNSGTIFRSRTIGKTTGWETETAAG